MYDLTFPLGVLTDNLTEKEPFTERPFRCHRLHRRDYRRHERGHYSTYRQPSQHP